LPISEAIASMTQIDAGAAQPAAATQAPAARRSGLRRPLYKHPRVEPWLPWIVVASLFLVWEGACQLFAIKEFILPAPSDIFASMWRWRWPILDNAAQTLMTTLIGLGFAIVFGLCAGVAIGSSTTLYNALYPVLIGFNSIPKVVIAPILIIWFGIGTIPAIIVAFLISFFPITVNVATGIATVEPELKDVMRALGASRLDMVRKVGVPRSMPFFFAAMKVAVTLAFVGSIISEFVGANKGIGNLITVASSRFDTPLVFAGALTTAFMGVALYTIANIVEKRTIGWATRGMENAQMQGYGG
jgi:NitT/TauT family transport system permease protein